MTARIFPITRPQREALFRVFQRDFPSWVTPMRRKKWGTDELTPVSSFAYQRFRKTVKPSFDGSGCVMLFWKGMWLGIERDGYTHS